MATIDDVAKHAGVSIMTVSRYINDNGYVGEKTRVKISKAIEALNYRRNMVAKSLITKKTKTIGLIIASISNPFYSEVILGIEDESYDRGYNVILCNADGKKKEQEYIEILLEKCVDGIIFSHLNISHQQITDLKDEAISCVLIDNETGRLDIGNINSDDVYGGFLATEYLISLGHRKIACIHGSLNFNKTKPQKKYEETFQFKLWNNRTIGYRKAMEKYELNINSNFILEGDGTSENGVKGGYEAMKKILAMEQKPTAIYAQNDLMAVGVINAIHEAGFKVPEDYSVIGQDGIALGEWIYPKLTTVALPRYELGRKAAKILIDMENNIMSSGMEEEGLLFKPSLHIKGSTRELRA